MKRFFRGLPFIFLGKIAYVTTKLGKNTKNRNEFFWRGEALLVPPHSWRPCAVI